MSQFLKSLSEKLINKANQLGTTAAESVVMSSKSKSIELKNGNIEKIETSEKLNVGIRVFFGKQSAAVSISSQEDKAQEEMITRAIAMAKETPPDEFSHLAEKGQFSENLNSQKLDLFDKKYYELDASTLKVLATDIEKSCLKAEGINHAESGVQYNLSNFHMASSNGFSNGYAQTSFQMFCTAIAEKDSLMERDFAVETRVLFNDLPPAELVGDVAAARAIARLDPKTPPTGSFPVLFDERVSNSLVQHLVSAINGAAISRGSSWLLDCLGENILPKNISLIEDPKRSEIVGSRPFDAEGLPTQKQTFVENGILKNLVLDLRSAKKLNLKPTGNAYRTSAFPPYPGVGNLELSCSNNSRSDLIKKMKTGFLVTSLIGSSVNQNNGDYSRGASGFWINDGEIAFPVNRCTIAGNLKKMLSGLITANDVKNHKSLRIPSILIEKMIVAGK